MKYSDIEVAYIDHMGNDKSVVDAARVSFDQDDYTSEFQPKDEKLINYLAKHDHWSPFAHTSIKFRVKAPIFVARQLVKHQVGGVWNEVSRRYVSSEPEFYLPEGLRGKPVNAKQGSSGTIPSANMILIEKSYNDSLDAYDRLLELDVAPELARMVLPLGSMTDWYWTGSLVFWDRVCKLRLDPHTQAETSIVAKYISDECSKLFPVAWKALQNG